ncbi:hypothetical protein NCC49_003513 [Naganishia albida]|nr:hypothetical protein NCC49_003513 [Naganishia albida]
MYLDSLQAKFEALLDAKFREFERRSLSPFFAACHQVEERWSRIESALDGHQEDLQVESVASEAYSSSTERSSVSQDPSSSPIVEPRSPASIGQRPGSFPAFDVSSPTTSNFSATPSELAEAIGVSTKDCNEYALAHFEDVYKAEEDIRSITAKALPKDSKIPAKTAPSVIKAPVNTVRKEIQPPVNNNPWTTVSRWHSKPVDSNNKSNIVVPSPVSGTPVLENVVESRGRRLQVLKNELRVKEENNKLIKVDPDGMAVRTLDPRPCHRYYLAKAGCDNLPCAHGHNYLLNDEHLVSLKKLVETLPCKSGKHCSNKGDCVYAHKCPYGSNCTWGTRCRFVDVPGGHPA